MDIKLLIILPIITLLVACGTDDGANDGDNDSAQDATLVQIGDSTSGSLSGSEDEIDFFKFTVTEESRIKITLSGPSDPDLDIILLDSDQNDIQWSANDNSTEEITKFLEPGQYFIVVGYGVGDSRSASYTLEIARIGDGNDSPYAAASLLYGASVTSTVHSEEDSDDYYFFNMGVDDQAVKINLTHESSTDINISLYKKHEYTQMLASSSTAGGDTEVMSALLEGLNSYVVRVQAVSGEGEYVLSVGDEAVSAVDTEIQFNTPVTGSFTSLHQAGAFDNYNYTLDASQQVTVTLTGDAGADYDLNIGDEGGVWGFSNNTGVSEESVVATIPAGNAYIRVIKISGEGNYTLTLQ